MQCPESNIEANWPLIYSALVDVGQASVRSCAGAIGTTTIETASKFVPCRELYNDPPGEYAYFEQMYGGRSDLGNSEPGDGARFFGRGYIQITGRANYTTYGQRLGIDLAGAPDTALDSNVAARVFAAYWLGRDIQSMADREDWVAVRRAVQGGSAGLARLQQIAGALVQSAKQRGLA